MNRLARLLTVTLVALTAMSLSGCDWEDGSSNVDTVSARMIDKLPSEFSELSVETPNWSKTPQPALVYEGKNATILVAGQPVKGRSVFVSELQMRGLAQTKNGRYFSFTYISNVRDSSYIPVFWEPPCTATSCRRFEDVRGLTRDEAKSWLFHDATFTAEAYKRIFNEEAPPKRVQA